MRKSQEEQKKLGEIDISKIEIDLRCRDEMPKILLGLQHLYCTPEIREEVFKILEEMIPKGTDPDNGRPGMDLWKILVLGCVKLNCNWDYDKLHDIVNNHKTLRKMLGHGIVDADYIYAYQTIKDNISLFTPEILDRINQVVVKAGHRLIAGKKNEKNELKGKCDSFVVETDVHYPTDINLLFDAIRKVISLISFLCSEVGISGWRQSNHNLKTIRILFRKAQKLKHSTSKDEEKKVKREVRIKEAHHAYINVVESFLVRVSESISDLYKIESTPEWKIVIIERYVGHARRQIDHIRRRVIEGEIIPHEEKLFSIFEPHTEWISKGKAGVPQELGLSVCVLEDQHRFILHHRVMEKETDDKVAVPMVLDCKKKFPNLKSCSFDKGFYTPANKKKLKEILDLLILPKKGKLSQKDKEEEYSEEFIHERNKHSAVESAINGIENHGLDKCRDHGIDGFKRYVGLSVLARNIETLGNIIQKKKLKTLQRRERLRLKLCKAA